MKRLALALLVSLAAAASAANAGPRVLEKTPPAPPRTGTERILIRTPAGDLVVALYEDAAPATTAQFKKMVEAGIYDGTHFARVEKNFVLQVSTADDRDTALTPDQRALLHPLALEAKAVKHHRGTLSMARPDADPNGALSSFSILLADAPHLDGKYTPFGQVEQGLDVLEELAGAPVAGTKPLMRLRIKKMSLFPNAAAAEPARNPRRPLPFDPAAAGASGAPGLGLGGAAGLAGAAAGGPSNPRLEVLTLILAMLVSSLLAVAAGPGVSSKVVHSLLMIILLLGSFGLIYILLPVAHKVPLVGLGLFALMVGLFKAMGRFESAVAPPPPPAVPAALPK